MLDPQAPPFHHSPPLPPPLPCYPKPPPNPPLILSPPSLHYFPLVRPPLATYYAPPPSYYFIRPFLPPTAAASASVNALPVGEDCSKEGQLKVPQTFHPQSSHKSRLIWAPKRPCAGFDPGYRATQQGRTVKTHSSLEFDALQPEAGDRTTVMIRNIPNKFSREMLLKLLDKHCRDENDKALRDGSPPSAYDFVYLPMDFWNKCNLGYGFVNFTTAAAACRLYRWLHRQTWNMFQTKKVSHVCYARIQGKDALLTRFRNTHFACDSEEYLPALLSPPRNGTTSRPTPCAVGKLTGMFPRCARA